MMNGLRIGIVVIMIGNFFLSFLFAVDYGSIPSIELKSPYTYSENLDDFSFQNSEVGEEEIVFEKNLRDDHGIEDALPSEGDITNGSENFIDDSIEKKESLENTEENIGTYDENISSEENIIDEKDEISQDVIQKIDRKDDIAPKKVFYGGGGGIATKSVSDELSDSFLGKNQNISQKSISDRMESGYPQEGIVFDFQGGHISSTDSGFVVIQINQCYSQMIGNLLPEDPHKQGYTFLGYSTCKNGEGEDCMSLGKYENFCAYDPLNEGNFILYAQYKQLPTLVIHSNGGSYSDSSSSFSKIIDLDKCYFDTVQNITQSDPQKEGYRFLGYSTCENYDGEKCVFLESTEDYCHSILFSDPQNFEIHLYAVYEQFPMILLDGNGGLFQNNKGFVYKIIDTTNKYWYLNPGNLAQELVQQGRDYPTKFGYNFLRYSTCKDENGTDNTCKSLGLYDNMNTSDFSSFLQQGLLRLYAIYQKVSDAETVNEYTVTFDFGDKTESFNVLHGEKLSPLAIEKIGYNSDRYYQGEKFDFDQEVTENMLLIANYIAEEYQIIYKVDKDVSHHNPHSYTVEDRIELGDAKRSGFLFLGWYTEKGEKIDVIEGTWRKEIILYARWIKQGFIISAPDHFVFDRDERGNPLKVSGSFQKSFTESGIFSVIDYEGSPNWYTTIAFSDLDLGNQKKAEVLVSSENYSFNNLVNHESSGNHLYSFIRKDNSSQSEYFELLNISLMIPSYVSSNEYSGSIVFTLYEE